MPTQNSTLSETWSWLEHDPLDQLRALRVDLLKKGNTIVDVSMINPDITPPRFLLDKLLEASTKPSNHCYAVSRGVRKLREAFAAKYRTRFGVDLDPEREICVSMGTKEAILHTLQSQARRFPSSSVLMGSPTYPAYIWAAKLCGLKPVFFDICSDEALLLRTLSEKLALTEAKTLILNFPHNPTGISVSEQFYQKLFQSLKSFPVLAINDFVYGEMGHQDQPVSGLKAARNCDALDQVVETYSLSKAYGVPGWRVGAILGSPRIVHDVARLKAHIDYGIFLPLQFAAASALGTSTDLVGATTAEYRERARQLCEGLKKLGWQVELPKYGASLWAKVPACLRRESSLSVCQELLLHAGVLVMPGSIFGEGYEEYVRFALVVPGVTIHRMLSLIAQYQERLPHTAAQLNSSAA